MPDLPPITQENPLEQVGLPPAPLFLERVVEVGAPLLEQALEQGVLRVFLGALQGLVMPFGPLFHALQGVCESNPY